MKAALFRSKSLPLTVTRAVHSSYEPPLLAQHIARIKELGLYLRGEPESIQGAHETFNAPADNLETLFLAQRVPESHGDWALMGNSCSLPSNFLAAQAPKLRRISLYNYAMDWSSPLLSASIVHLEVVIPLKARVRGPSQAQPPATQRDKFYDCLAGLPSLEALVLGGCIPSHAFPPELSDNRPVIHMVNLQRLSIDDRAWPAADLLGHLAAPACTSLKLKVLNSSDQNMQRNYELLSQMLKKSSIAVDVPSRPIQTVRVCVLQMGQHPWLTMKGWSVLRVAGDGYPIFQPESEPSFDFTLDLREGPRPKMEEAAFMTKLRHILSAIPPANVSTLSLELPQFGAPSSGRPLARALQGWDSVRSLDCGDSSTQMVFGALARQNSSPPAASDSDDIFLRGLEAVSVPEGILSKVYSVSQTFFGDILVPKLRSRKEMGFPLKKLYIVRSHPGFPHYSWVENLQQVVPVLAHQKSASREGSRAPRYSALPPDEAPAA
ncbi:hypothetical protein DENSPDRAFT_879873 [Dentipellis sp. KUC8613]|nr:hypothetical protein DENSPDRAFT_879873 [Dentipellis sp. KUC8613]